jgi:hypothetical protein
MGFNTKCLDEFRARKLSRLKLLCTISFSNCFKTVSGISKSLELLRDNGLWGQCSSTEGDLLIEPRAVFDLELSSLRNLSSRKQFLGKYLVSLTFSSSVLCDSDDRSEKRLRAAPDENFELLM